MDELKPISPELLAWHINNIEVHREIVDRCRIPCFSNEFRRTLSAQLQDDGACDLIEIAARLGNFGDARSIRENRQAVAKLLKKDGAPQPRGRRPTYGLPELVETLTPILLHFGLPLGLGEGSPLVKILRGVAKEMRVTGDPRDELRRLRRRQREVDAKARKAVFEAFAKGIACFGLNPPLNISP